MFDGGRFVETVARLGYPGAATLKGEDFDWMFDRPEHQRFLRYVCSRVNENNVLSAEEVRSFRALRDSGKPVLDKAELADALKACQATSGQAPYSCSQLEEPDVEKLEEELQALRMKKKLKTQRLKKLQVMAIGHSDTALRLASRQEDTAHRLRDELAALGAENAETNGALQALTEEVKRLASFLRVDCPLQESDGATPARAPPFAQGPPVFLSQLSLEPYLHQEEVNTKTLALYTQKQFFTGIANVLETSSQENFQLLDLSSCAEREGAATVEARRAEMARLQWAHIVNQHQLLLAQAEEHGTRAGLQWITQTLRGKAMPCRSAPALQARQVGFQQELQAVGGELEALRREAVPAALRESARLLNVPVVRGDFKLQLARQEYYTSRQDRVCACLLRQKASFELLSLSQELELRRGRTLLGLLQELSAGLECAGASLRQRLHVFSQPEYGLAHASQPCAVISTKDTAFIRLYKALELGREASGARDDPFRTFQGLERAAQTLQEELRSAQEALGCAIREQASEAADLEADCDLLRGAAYSGLQLVLTPQVCAKPTQELWPNSQELRGHLRDLEAELCSLNKMMQDIVGEIQAKRAKLERSRALKRERDLYVYFHLDDKLLKRVVEDLERSVCGKGEHS